MPDPLGQKDDSPFTVTDPADQTTPPRDDRPQPRYGELAPPGWTWNPPVDPKTENGPDDDAPTKAGAGRPATDRSAAGLRPSSGATTGPRTVGATIDRIVTIVLLTFGAVYAVQWLLSPNSFVDALNQAYALQGLEAYGRPDLGLALGLSAGIAQTLVVVTAVLLAIRRLRSGRRAMLVPLLGIVANMLVMFVIVAIAIFSDPSFAQAMSEMSTSAP